MAYRRSNGKGRGRKMEPAVQTLTFEYTVPRQVEGTPGTFIGMIDVSQCASLVNRRFYRQGLNWAVAGLKLLTLPSTLGDPLAGSISVSKLPSTWVMSNAWEKGFHAWQKMNREALEEAESVRPRFLDFKIYADEDHHAAGIAQNLLPVSEFRVVATPGEWEASKFEIPDNTLGATGGVRTREVIAVGPNFPGGGASGLDAVSLLEGYAASRGLPDVLDPNAPLDASDVSGSGQNWISQLFSDGSLQTDEVIETMVSENNIAPYPFENDGVHVDTMYPSGANQLTGLQIHDFELVTGTTVGGTTRLKGGLFPCGLIKLYCQNRSENSDMIVTLQLDLVGGPHRGYMAQSMLEA